MKIIKVYSKMCGPCRVLENYLQAANIEHESIDIMTDEGEKFAVDNNISAVPVLLVVNDNEEVIKRHTGLLSIEDLKKFVNETD